MSGFPPPYETPTQPSPVFEFPGFLTQTRAARAHIKEDAVDKHGRPYKRRAFALVDAYNHTSKGVERILRDTAEAEGLNENAMVITAQEELGTRALQGGSA